MHDYSEVSCTEFSGTCSLERVRRIAALVLIPHSYWVELRAKSNSLELNVAFCFSPFHFFLWSAAELNHVDFLFLQGRIHFAIKEGNGAATYLAFQLHSTVFSSCSLCRSLGRFLLEIMNCRTLRMYSSFLVFVFKDALPKASATTASIWVHS